MTIEPTSPIKDALLRMRAVEATTSLKKSKLYELIAEGKFPRPVKLGRASAWPASAINRWIEEQTATPAK